MRHRLVSFIIPAHNERALLGATLDSIAWSAAGVGIDHEVIVVDDASDDGTGEIAADRGARVVRVELRNIAAVRNAGARQASGDVLIFVDADTIISTESVRQTIEALVAGGVGGGARVTFEGRVPLLNRLYIALFMLIWNRLNLAAGCYLFASRDAFDVVGGFDEKWYVSEEMHLSQALKARGRFVVVRAPVSTSARKLRDFGPCHVWGLGLRLLLAGPKSWQRREGLDLWYGRRH
jgi:glycosyltransferase involved in cell wall biosynthesis